MDARADLPLTVNAVMHRQNLHQLPTSSRCRVDLDADRLEVATCSITAGR